MAINYAGALSGIGQEVETLTRAARTVLRPIDVGAQGSYRKAMRNGGAATAMAAGLAAASPIFSFRWAPTATTLLCLVRRIQMSAADGATAFTAGAAQFEGFVARSFSASDTGGTAGTLTGNNGKLRTSFATTALADFRIAATGTLTAGTRTLDTDPFFEATVGALNTAGTQLFPNLSDVFYPGPTEWPLVLANNEGFVIQATVPATGTWNFSVAVAWDEVSSFAAAGLT